jgi:DNA-binding NarL/FixJ family response regulator
MGLFTYSQFGVWLQINTPENVLNIRSYPVHKLAGLSLNVRSLHALLLGIDPDNSEIHEHYSMETLGLLKLMEQLAQSVETLQELRENGTPLQLNLHLEEFSHELVAQAVKLGYHGVIVKPAATAIAHACIVEVEQSRLAHSV